MQIVVRRLRVAGLFAGIGGLELGLHASGHQSVLLCENDPSARAVLRHRFPDVDLDGDINQLESLPSVDLVAAGFPCTDLSQVGRARGIRGRDSGLVTHVFRLLEAARRRPSWVLFENVPFMLQLQQGRAMRYLTRSLEDLGYGWAYRVVDTRAFGLPQRRQRVLLLAGIHDDPREVLLSEDTDHPDFDGLHEAACGFYWTEGNRGLGWAVNAIPTLKGGSAFGIPSPPAILTIDGSIRVPDIHDAERLQGFTPYWTSPAQWIAGARRGTSWRLLGNAVSVPVSRWVGRRLSQPKPYSGKHDRPFSAKERWPRAAWGHRGRLVRCEVSAYPVNHRYRDLENFPRFPSRPLSLNATRGFLRSLAASSLHEPHRLEKAITKHSELLFELESTATETWRAY